MKRLIALFLSIIMTLSMLTGCSSKGNFQFEDEADPVVTRGQWIEMLAANFGMTDYEQQNSYFKDLSRNDDIFGYVQSSVEWDVIRDTGDKFNKDEKATLEFVVTTAVFATGIDISSCEGESDIEKAISYAEDKQIAYKNYEYDEGAKLSQCQNVLHMAMEMYRNQPVETVEVVELIDGVEDLRENAEVEIIKVAENQYLVKNMEPVEGQVLITPPTEGHPAGEAIKVTAVTDNGDNTYMVTTVLPELHEVVQDLEFSGTAVPKYEDIRPAEGVTIHPYGYLATADNSTASENFGVLGRAESGSGLVAVPMGQNKGLSFDLNVNFVTGGVSTSGGWGPAKLMGSLVGSEDIDNGSLDDVPTALTQYKIDKYIEEYKAGKIDTSELKNKLSEYQDQNGIEDLATYPEGSGYEIIGTVSVKNLYITIPEFKLEKTKVLGIPKGIDTCKIEVNADFESSISVKGKVVDKDFPLGTIPITLGATGGVVEVNFFFTVGLEGEIEFKAKLGNNVVTEYRNGKIKKVATTTSEIGGAISAETQPGFKVEGELAWLSFPLADLEIGITAKVKAEVGINKSVKEEFTEDDELGDKIVIVKETKASFEVNVTIPIVKIAFGKDNDTLAHKFRISFEVTLVGDQKSRAPIKAKEIELVNVEKVIWSETITIPLNPEDLIEPSPSVEPSPSESPLPEDEKSNDSQEGGTIIESNILSLPTYFVDMIIGDKYNMLVMYPSGYKADDFVWTVKDSTVATVSGKGTIVAKESGITTVQVSSKDGKYTARFTVSVSDGVDHTGEAEKILGDSVKS